MPELFILEKAVKKGYLIANIKLEFDEKGKIKDNYEINGFVRDARVNILNKYSLQKVNFIFKYKKDDLQIDEMFLSLNNLDFKSEKIIVKKTKNDFLIRGDINHKKFDMNEENIDQFIKPFLPGFSIEKTVFSSENTFSLQIKEGFKIDNLEINSNMIIEQLSVKNDFDLKNIPVVIISNSGQAVELDRAKELGARDWLIKTEFDPGEVIQKVKEQIG